MDIPEFNRSLLLSRNCGSCPLRGKPFVGADSWNGKAAPVDVLFLGLRPRTEEVAQGLPFVGRSGLFLRKVIALARQPGTWAMANSILCSVEAVPEPSDCMAFCRGNVAKVWRRFAPKVIVPCGAAAFLFGLGEGDAGLHVSRGRNGKAAPAVVVPILDPAAIVRFGGQASPDYGPFQLRINEAFRIGALLDGGDFERVLEREGISWRGLFGLSVIS